MCARIESVDLARREPRRFTAQMFDTLKRWNREERDDGPSDDKHMRRDEFDALYAQRLRVLTSTPTSIINVM